MTRGPSLLVMLVATACSSGGKTAASHDAAPADGGVTRDAPATSPPCPSAAPDAGAACSGTGLACGYVDPRYSPAVYGSSVCAVECTYGDDPRHACRPDFACVDGGWALQRAALAPQYPCASPPPAACPATLDAAVNADCPVAGAVCPYGASACVCTVCTGGCMARPDAGVPVTWQCDQPPSTPGCPASAPNYGTRCVTEGLVCDYGNCLAKTWMEAQCSGGVWRRTDNGCAT